MKRNIKRNILGVIGGYIGFYLFIIFLAIIVVLLETFNLPGVSILNIQPVINAFCSLISGIIVGYITQRWKTIIITGLLLTITWILILTPLDNFIKNPQWYLLNLHLVIVLSIVPFSVFGGYIGKKIVV